jgi:diguanylate cyclase (GGDEF)-like protein/PAS domain S-box-containing protein
LITDEEGKVLSSNIALAKMLNYSNTEEFITTNTSLTSIFNNDVAAKIAEGKNDLFETRIKRRDGNSIWTEISSGAINKGDNKIILQAIIRDITERKKIEKKIKYLSFHDFLTGLYNRAFFEEELSRLDNDRNFPLGIIIGDVNGLKLINDAYGHDRGDELLVRISKVLKESFRKGDIIARWGGDEFIVVLPVTSEEIMNRIVDRITRKLEEHSTEELPLSISFGVELKTDTNDDIRAVIKSAEDKMYRHKMIEQKSVHRAIIATLEKALEERDYETEAHVRRMQELAITLGKEVKVSKNVLDELKLLAALHDIGKIAIADNILLKPGKLSPEEWTMVKKHPEIGFRIANSSADLGLIAEGILYHHESWNGSGYPKGLKGEEIPLISRIIAIVDAYDAMTNDRPYRAALSKDEAIKELRKCAGTQFDPNLVETFITIITQQSLIENVMA